MRKFTPVVGLMLSLLLAIPAAAQVRGKARLQGTVVDKATGNPIDGAKVTIAPANASTTPIITKTNAKGRWSALGLTSGQWNIDIEAAGYAISRGTANVSEVQMLPPIATELVAEVKEEAPAVQASGVPQEVVDAVNRGQDLVAQEKYAEAIPELEKALVHLADNLPLKQLLAHAYYKTGALKKAIAMLEAVHAADAANTGVSLLLTNIYLEDGQLDRAKALLATVPESAITDPTIYVNIGILFLNKTNPAEAATILGKAVALDPSKAEPYYYRGLAYVQMKKTAEAKADFTKVVELAPESAEARDSRQLLAGLK